MRLILSKSLVSSSLVIDGSLLPCNSLDKLNSFSLSSFKYSLVSLISLSDNDLVYSLSRVAISLSIELISILILDISIAYLVLSSLSLSIEAEYRSIGFWSLNLICTYLGLVKVLIELSISRFSLERFLILVELLVIASTLTVAL